MNQHRWRREQLCGVPHRGFS